MEDTLDKEEIVVEESSNKIKDIKKFFDLANDNVKSATGIFNRCVEMKKKLELDTKELEKQRSDHANATEQEIEKIKHLKDEVFSRLKEKKLEVDTEITLLKEEKLLLSNEKSKFNIEKKSEIEKFNEQIKKHNQEVSIKNKELDKDKRQLEEEKKKLEEDKLKVNEKADELAENLNRFNELVKQFTSGIE